MSEKPNSYIVDEGDAVFISFGSPNASEGLEVVAETHSRKLEIAAVIRPLISQARCDWPDEAIVCDELYGIVCGHHRKEQVLYGYDPATEKYPKESA